MSAPESVSSAAPPSRLRRWLDEPLLRFLLIGAGLFAGLAGLTILHAIRSSLPRWADLAPPYAIGGGDMFRVIQRVATL